MVQLVNKIVFGTKKIIIVYLFTYFGLEGHSGLSIHIIYWIYTVFVYI